MSVNKIWPSEGQMEGTADEDDEENRNNSHATSETQNYAILEEASSGNGGVTEINIRTSSDVTVPNTINTDDAPPSPETKQRAIASRSSEYVRNRINENLDIPAISTKDESGIIRNQKPRATKFHNAKKAVSRDVNARRASAIETIQSVMRPPDFRNKKVKQFVRKKDNGKTAGFEDPDSPKSDGPGRGMLQKSKTITGEALAKIEVLQTLSEKEADDPDSERWIYSFKAGFLFGIFIFLNFVLIAVETDYSDNSDRWIWLAIEIFFVVVFSVEIGLRIHVEHVYYFYDRWNVFDFFLILLGYIALIIELSRDASRTTSENALEIPVRSGVDQKAFDMLTMLRVMRLLRLARVVRVFRFFQPLYLLAMGIIDALRSMFWVGILMIIMVAVFAIFVTRLLGNREILKVLLNRQKLDKENVTGQPVENFDALCMGTDSFQRDQWSASEPCQLYVSFGTVSKSMWTLFQVTTLENWPTVSYLSQNELIGGSIHWWLFFLLYIIMSNIILLNLLTGMIIESLLSASKQKEQDKMLQEELEAQRVFTALEEIFRFSDTDCSGALKRSEFIASLFNQDVQRLFKSVDIDIHDAEDLFTMLDMDDSGLLTLEEFLEGFSRCRGVAQSKHIISLHHELYNKTKAMISDTKSEVRLTHTEICERLGQQELSLNHLTVMLTAICGNNGITLPDATHLLPTRSISERTKETTASSS